MTLICPQCSCNSADGSTVHAVAAALADGDIDRALDEGLLETRGCARCSAPCIATLLAARNERLHALAARDRYRARNARLERLATERAARRSPAPPSLESAETSPAVRSSLPSAAAAVLARAKARAAERHKP